jgi:hypothetical protein
MCHNIHPSKCYHWQRAQALLNSLENKWDPRVWQPEDYEEYRIPPTKDDPDAAVFDSRVTTGGNIANAFRIFTEGNSTWSTTAPDTRFANNQTAEVGWLRD